MRQEDGGVVIRGENKEESTSDAKINEGKEAQKEKENKMLATKIEKL